MQSAHSTPVMPSFVPSVAVQTLQADVRSLQRLLAQQKRRLAAQRSEDFGFEWEELSSEVAVLRDPLQRNGWSQTSYRGFATKRAAEIALGCLRRRSPHSHFQLRKARRLPNYRWEIKAIDVAPEFLQAPGL